MDIKHLYLSPEMETIDLRTENNFLASPSGSFSSSGIVDDHSTEDLY